jgi:hypothetical protein
MKKKPKNIPSPYKFAGTPIYRDTTALPFAAGGPLNDRDINGKLLNSTYASPLGNMFKYGGFGEDQGTFDYARSNYASSPGNSFKDGGQFQGKYSLPEDSYRQGGNNLHDSVYASSPQQYPAVYKQGGSLLSMSNTPQMEGEGKDLVYAHGGNLYPNGGNIYTYSGRPDAQYQKDSKGNWLVNAPSTGGKFIPLDDPSGARAKLLNAQAKPLTTKSPYQLQEEARRQGGQSRYDMMASNKPQVAESTAVNNTTPRSMPVANMHIKTGLEKLREAEEKKRNAQNPAIDPRTGNYRPMSAGEADWVWSAPLAGSAALQAAGAVGSMALPGMSAIPGATVGNLANSGFIASSLYNTPKNAGEWYDVSQGKKDWGEAALGSAEIAAGLIGSGGGAKAALQEAEKLGLKNVITGKAPIKDVFKRDDLINIKTAEDLAKFKAAQAEGRLGETTNRFYSSVTNPDTLNYAKGEGEVFVHTVPQTKAAAAGKSVANIKPKGANLTAKERSVPTNADIESMISSGALSGHSEETLAGLREVAQNPEGYWNLAAFKSNPELQELIKNPNLVNPAEHFLPRPSAEDFKLMSVGALGATRPKLINTQKITDKALAGLQEEGIGAHVTKHEVAGTIENKHGEENNHNNIKHLPNTALPVEAGIQGPYNTNPMNYRQGGGIHIKPSHEGDFTAKANAAKMSVQAFASEVLNAPEGQYDPSTRQQANFARNAAGWNHAMGGNMYANGGSFNNPGFRALPQGVQNKIRSNSFAEGGEMAQLTEFNAGGKHSENPIGGIPQGVAPDGNVNLVEQGETKLNSSNYIFSDTLKLDKNTATQFGLPKTEVSKTFATISKKLNRPDSRRENDSIEEAATKRDLDNLMGAQEQYKKAQVEQKMQEIQALDPNAFAQMQGQGQPQQQGMPEQGQMAEQGAPEMAQQSVQPMGMPEGQPVDPNQMSPEMMAQMPEAQQGAPVMALGGGMYKCGGKMYNFGGNMYANGGRLMWAGGSAGDGVVNPGLSNPYTQNNGLTGAASNGLNDSTLIDSGFRDYSAGTGATEGPSAASKAGSAMQYGTAALGAVSAFQNAQQGPGTKQQQTGAGINAAVDMVAGTLTPWYAAAKGLSDTAISLIPQETIVDPETGKTVTQAKSREGQALADTFTPAHETIINDMAEGNWVDAGLNTLTGGVYNTLDNYFKGTNKKEFEDIQNKDKPVATSSGGTGAVMAKNGGRLPSYHQFPAIYPTYANNAGPMGQDLGNLYAEGGILGGPGDPPTAAAPKHPLEYTQKSYKTETGKELPYAQLGYRDRVLVDRAHGHSVVKDEKGNLVYTPSNPQSMGYYADEDQSTLDLNKQNTFFNTAYGDTGTESGVYNAGGKWTTVFDPSLGKMIRTRPTGKDYQTAAVMEGGYNKSLVLNPDYTVNTVGKEYTGDWTLPNKNTQSTNIIPVKPPVNTPVAPSVVPTFKQGGYLRDVNMNLQPGQMPGVNMMAYGQQMYQPLDHVTQYGGNLYAAGGDLPPGGPGDTDFDAWLALQEGNYQGGGTNTPTAPTSSPNNYQDPYSLDPEEYSQMLNAEEGPTSNTLEAAQMDLMDAETDEEYAIAMEKYQSELQRLEEGLAKDEGDYKIKRNLGRDLMIAAPAVTNIATGLFEKAEQLNPEEYMTSANLEPYSLNIDNIRRGLQQNYAQSTAAARNAGMSGGNYMANVGALNAVANRDLYSALIAKENADAQSFAATQAANKGIESENKKIKMGVKDFNLKSKANKRQAFTTGLTQIAGMAENAYNLDAQMALAKAVSPTYGNRVGFDPSYWKQVQELVKNQADKAKTKKDITNEEINS